MVPFIKKATLSLLGLGLAVGAYAADGDFELKGSVQAQGRTDFHDDDTVLDEFWFRANFGGKYSSESMDAQINIRMFAPKFGNDIAGNTYDKITADVYWGNYKWDLGNHKLNLKLGHWKTDWSESTNFGTYIDKSLKTRGSYMRDYAHDAFELGWKKGLSNLNVMLATTSNVFNTGYVRIEESLKFTFPLELQMAYRVNAIDAMVKSAVQTHRLATKAAYSVTKELKVYGEIGFLTTGENDKVSDASVAGGYAIAPEYGQGTSYVPVYLGVNIPTLGVLDGLMLEAEYIKNRSDFAAKADDFAFVLAAVKKMGKMNAQFSAYTGNELKAKDITMLLRLTTTIK